jgi:hypothetical protein
MTNGLKRLAEMRKKAASEASGAAVDLVAPDPDAIVVERETAVKVARVVSSDKIERYRRVIEEAGRVAEIYGWATENADFSNSPTPFPTKRTHLAGRSPNDHTMAEVVFSFDSDGEMNIRFYASSQNTEITATGGVGAFNHYLTQVANANAVVSRLLSAYDK